MAARASISTLYKASTIPTFTPNLFRRFVSGNAVITSNENKQIAESKSEYAIPADVISGAPDELRERTVRIFRPSRTTSQQGKAGTRLWRVDFDILEGGARWENPLMGWASSADYMQALTMKFSTKEDAIHFVEKQGWNYYVQEPKEQKFRKKTYANNFVFSPGKLRLIRTK